MQQYPYTFQYTLKQVFNGASWLDVSGSTDTKTIIIKAAQVYYTVRYEDWDGTLLKKQNVVNGGTATAPEDLERTGYIFTGWDKYFDEITYNMTVTAQYTVITYTVRFNTNSGNNVASQKVEYGGSAVRPEGSEKDGYAFGGWYRQRLQQGV